MTGSEIEEIKRTLSNEFALESVQELEGELVFSRQSFLSDDGLHRGSIFSGGVLGVLFGSSTTHVRR